METSPGGAAPVKSENHRSSTSPCREAKAGASGVSVKSEKPASTGCEVIGTNSNNNNIERERQTKPSAITDSSSHPQGPALQQGVGLLSKGSNPNEPLFPTPTTTSRQSERHTSSGRVHSFGPSPMHGLTSPSDFQSICGTPTSVSQLLNLPSSAFSLDGLEFPSPLGSGRISPLASARLGRKRALSSVSPLSTSSLDLNNLIRTSPTSLVNYITNSRTSSAGSMGHLSPSLFINSALFQPPYTRPLFSLRNAAHPPVGSAAGLPSSGAPAQDMTAQCTSEEGHLVTVKTEGGIETEHCSQETGERIRGGPEGVQLSYHQQADTSESESEGSEGVVLSGPSSVATVAPTLETVKEEGAISEDEGMHTDPTEYSSAITENESELESKPRIIDGKPQRVYYSYPSVEEPHNNQCRWEDCNQQCNGLDDLVRHVNTDHIYRDSRKDFVCQWSGCVRQKRPFKAQYMLLVHMRRHTGEKPHKCTYEGCTKSYSRLENLKTHLRSHTGERPYICKYEGCGKAFSNASDCAKHMNRTHSDEKPYACPNPGCTKRYTDPSSRRKHMKNCLGNKKARTDDRDPMSGADEESCAESTSTKSSTSSRRASKPRKSERKRPIPFGPRVSSTPSAMGSDPGYASSGSQGYVSTGYNSPGYETEEMMYQQSLSDPLDPNQGVMPYPPSYPSLSHHAPPSSHAVDYVSPNGKASRQKGGGLTMPAGRNMNVMTMNVPQRLLHTHQPHGSSQFSPQPQPSSHFSPQLPLTFPSSHSNQSGLSSYPSHLQPPPGPRPPMDAPPPQHHMLPQISAIPAPHLPLPMSTNNENSPPMNAHLPANEYLLAQMSCNPRAAASSGYYSNRSISPGKVFGGSSRRSPSDDGSSVSSSVPGYGAASHRSSIHSNSYSTFSESTNSRMSSPSSNSGRSDSLRLHPHQPPSPMTPFLMPKPPLSVGTRGFVAGGDHKVPLKHSVQMPASRVGVTYMRRFSDDVHSERSWCSYSSHSSRYSSELSDDILEKLPSGSRKNSFAKIQPLPLPESMEHQFSQEMPDEGMEFSSSGGQGDLLYLNEPSPMQTGVNDVHDPSLPASGISGHRVQGTLPLHHYGIHSQEIPSQDTPHVGLYTQLLNSDACQSEYDDKFRVMSPNMMVGDMASFASTLPEETHFFETLLSSQAR